MRQDCESGSLEIMCMMVSVWVGVLKLSENDFFLKISGEKYRFWNMGIKQVLQTTSH